MTTQPITTQPITTQPITTQPITTQPITIELPEPVLRQLARMAKMLQQPIEALIAQSVLSNLPPSIEAAPLDLQPELLVMQGLSSEALRQLAQSQVAVDQIRHHSELLEKNTVGRLTATEQQELVALRQRADRLMLRKAYAWKMLRWRGERMPALDELPIPQ